MAQRELYRELYIDRLRTAITPVVLYCHAAMSYGATGSWFYRELPVSSVPSSIALTMLIVTNQTYLMGLFFLLSGYFTPLSLDRKGPTRFLLDRALRLGVPLLFFGFLLGPLTVALDGKARGYHIFGTTVFLIRTGNFINGPLWFAEALLLFSLVYCLWRSLVTRLKPSAQLLPTPIPGQRTWIVSALAVGIGSLLLRVGFPNGIRVLGLWIGDFSSYIFLFGLGVVAKRHNWLAQLSSKQAKPWLIAALIAWLPLLPICVWAVSASRGNPISLSALSWPSVVLDFWEPILAWGIIASLLLWFREHLNRPSAVWDWLGRRAYAVYILHAPVLVGICVLLRHWPAPALVKFAVTGTLACVATWLIADPFVRLPGAKRVL